MTTSLFREDYQAGRQLVPPSNVEASRVWCRTFTRWRRPRLSGGGQMRRILPEDEEFSLHQTRPSRHHIFQCFSITH
ncbi:DUF1799 domain-containing protein [Burkholderia multivorans]|nr:DUF1799 domain-containing protein [Burkholderia multivorans]